MTDFKMIRDEYSWDKVHAQIYDATDQDVQHALEKDHLTLSDFRALISPAAAPYLEQMAQKTQQITQRRFGKTIQLYAPLYLSNECQNICTYCGFSMDNKIKRKTLSNTELLLEAMALKAMGINHILLGQRRSQQNCRDHLFPKCYSAFKTSFFTDIH
ncbi:2-iminoacetate synthase [Sphingobacterium multivorum]|uniref:2-iminoacetate synthase n=1 Tax=Sphingobacterium multivorum TaxID=28454 RepID=A0A2X2JKT1_SPHMU|nr:2-iminoacetate synthase [Sphingobacterium multivorum]